MYHGERLNSISHLVGTIFALMASGALLTVSLRINTTPALIGFNVFGITMVLLYTISTIYHSVREPQLKRKLKILDHISIYLFIAGTYTPLMLVSLSQGNGWLILSSVWGLAVLGIAAELLLSGRVVKICQVISYLGMGWVCSFDLDNVRAALPEEGFFWLLTGGIAYTAGIVFYVLDKLNCLTHAHGIWHFFVLAGSVSHFICVIGFVR
jgi:hemolysin III